MDDLVIVEISNQSISVWHIERITVVYPGPDESVGVVTINTQNEGMKRPVIKVVKLPSDE